MNLKAYDSIVLLILRILYDEKKRELSAIEEVIVNLGDIQDKFVSLNIRDQIHRQNHHAKCPEPVPKISDRGASG